MKNNSFSSPLSRVFDMHWNSFSIQAAPLILRLFNEENTHGLSHDLLDVCCGSGHLGRFFLEAGFTVTGIDLSEEAIRLAKSKTDHFGNSAHWFVGDASNFNTMQKYSIVTSTFDSLNYLENIGTFMKSVSCIARHLLVNGIFIFDLYTAKGMITLNSISIDEKEEITSIIRGFYNPTEGQAFLSFSGFTKNNNDSDSYSRFGQSLRLCVYEIAKVKRILLKSNFKDIRYYKINAGGLEQVDDPEAVERVFICARRDKA